MSADQLFKCRDCGYTTRKSAFGAPNGSYPERAAVYASHRYEVVK